MLFHMKSSHKWNDSYRIAFAPQVRVVGGRGGFNSWHNNIYGSGWQCVDCRGSFLEGFCSVILGAICNDTTIFSCLGRCFFISDCLCGSFCFCGLSGDFVLILKREEYFGSNFYNKKHFGMINSFTFFYTPYLFYNKNLCRLVAFSPLPITCLRANRYFFGEILW